MSEHHQFGKSVPDGVKPPDPFWADKEPEEWVGREYVGDRQCTYTVRGQNDTVEYRIGLNELSEIVIDRCNHDRYFRSPEPTRIGFDDAPEKVREAAIELLIEHVPEAAALLEEAEAETEPDPQPEAKPKPKRQKSRVR